MSELQFTIFFDKYLQKNKKLIFKQGLHIVYGESGVGKSYFLKSFFERVTDEDKNFILHSPLGYDDVFMINQNPDTQLIGRTVRSELSFNSECLQKDYDEIDAFVKKGLKEFSVKISGETNPGFLSGGEKELLNIITATQLRKKVLLIDDGLSFLSDKIKPQSINILNGWIKDNNGIVIWCTSDYDDLKYGAASMWILSSSSFSLLEKFESKEHSPLLNPKGHLNLKIDNLKFRYENKRLIFENLSINVKNTKCLGFIGNNGSGKTTLAGLCFGDLKPTKGSLELKIRDNSNLKIGYVDQFPENLLLLLKLGDFIKKLQKLSLIEANKIESIKHNLMLFKIKWDKVKFLNSVQISWVELRIILIIILTHCSFQLLILDEPSFGLGWRQRVMLRSFLKKSMINKHFIIVSHDKKFTRSLCDQIIDFDMLKI